MTSLPARQRGIVLIVALIVLAAMSLAAIGVMRSVFTSNRVAGNLAFQQSATHSAQAGIERAVRWLVATSGPSGAGLFNDLAPVPNLQFGYFASRPRAADPTGNQSWEQHWDALVQTGRVNVLPRDDAGNQVSFVIHRLCNAAGPRGSGAQCTASADDAGSGNSKTPGAPRFEVPSQYYYRITARVEGPRKTLSFVQAVVAI